MQIASVFKFIGLFLLVLLLSLQAIAYTSYHSIPITGTSQVSDFDKSFVHLMQRWQVPGASVAIINKGQVVLARGYGWANVQERQPVYADNLFRIGSISKTITAITILKLVQDGKLKLSQPAYQLLDDLAPLQDRHINKQIYKITIANLLNMSSGWITDGPSGPDPMFGPWSYPMLSQIRGQTPPDCETAARMMMSVPMQFHPGTRFSYSNLNYCLLGLIISKTYRNGYQYSNYEEFVRSQILAPIGIQDMHIGNNAWQQRDPNEVIYYTYSPSDPNPNANGLPYSDDQAILQKNFSDGGWVASSVDMAKLFYNLGHQQILSSDTTNTMVQRPAFQRHSSRYFAYGVLVKRIHGHTYWVKTGCFTGTSGIAIYEVGGTSYVALFNTRPVNYPAFLNQVQRLLIHYR